ncbi:MAG: hypothetical protein ACFB0B_19100 [Thermonemataceae bacterium]
MEVLCINKETPEVRCNGKCYVTKELKKTEEPSDRPISSQNNEKAEILLFYLSASKALLKPLIKKIKLLPFTYLRKTTQFIKDCFHPPEM